MTGLHCHSDPGEVGLGDMSRGEVGLGDMGLGDVDSGNEAL